MIQNSNNRFFILGLIIVLTACASIQTPTVTEVTNTSSPAFTSIQPITNTSEQTQTPTVDVRVLEESTSPDGVWTATITRTINGKNYNLRFVVRNTQNNQIWLVENSDFTEPKNPLEGYKYPYLFQWSTNGNYLYFSHLSTGGDGCFVLSKPGGVDLQRFDLTTGEIASISQTGGRWMTLSPNEEELAYVDGWGGNMNVLDLESNNIYVFQLPAIQNDLGMETDTSNVFWSSDGKTFIYSHLLGVCDYQIWYQ